MSKTEKQKVGDWGEEQACSFLVNQGYRIVDRNYIYQEGDRKSELDIVAWDESGLEPVLCFVEVKTRGQKDGSAHRAVGKSKTKKMKFIADAYCYEKNINPAECWIRFELATVHYDKIKKDVVIEKQEIPSFMFT